MQRRIFSAKTQSAGLSVRRIDGITLMGMLVSIAISIPVIGGVLVFYTNALESAAYMNSAARLQENGRFAIDHIARTLRMNRYDDPNTPLLVPVEFSGTTSADTALSMVGFILKAGTDVVSISHEGAPQIRDCQGVAVASGSLVTNTYAISDNNELICGAVGNPTVIAEGIEDMQILYGIDSDADDVANRYVLESNVTNWSDVVSIRVSLLVNSVEAVYSKTIHGCKSCSTFNPPASNLLHGEFHTTIRFRNL